jgi:hypothetical protein
MEKIKEIVTKAYHRIAEVLRLEDPPRLVIVDECPNRDRVGEYRSGEHKIVIYLDMLLRERGGPVTLTHIILHELRHFIQYKFPDLPEIKKLTVDLLEEDAEKFAFDNQWRFAAWDMEIHQLLRREERKNKNRKIERRWDYVP